MELQELSKNDARKWLKKGRVVYLYKTLHNKNLLWAIDKIIPHLNHLHMFTLKPNRYGTEKAE